MRSSIVIAVTVYAGVATALAAESAEVAYDPVTAAGAGTHVAPITIKEGKDGVTPEP